MIPTGLGAGDQGMMFGFACDETPERMPLPITLAHRITRRLAAVRKNGELSYLRPDGKAQVTVEYENGKPVRVNTVVLSTQHDEDADPLTLRQDMIERVIKPCIPAEMLDAETKYYINPTGRFVLGGPAADTGLTGRKIIVDTYGGYARHGGGAFSGKDATKVDRSAAYMARNIAKTIVEAGAAHRCEIQLSYAIGVARRFPSMWKRLVPTPFLRRRFFAGSSGTMTFARRGSSRSLGCGHRSLPRRRPMATSAGMMLNSAGRSATPRHWPS